MNHHERSQGGDDGEECIGWEKRNGRARDRLTLGTSGFPESSLEGTALMLDALLESHSRDWE